MPRPRNVRDACGTDSIEATRRTRARAAAEIAFVILCVFIAEWVVIPIFGRHSRVGMIPVAAVFVFGFFSHRTRGESARDIGFSGHNFGRASCLLLLWMIPAGVILLGAGFALGSLHRAFPLNPGGLFLSQLALFLWGLMQQYALQAIVNRRAQDIWGGGAVSIGVVALIFASLHLPNLWLTLATLVGGVFWAWVYQRAPNLLALALSHSLMTTVLASSLSKTLLHGLRVGYHYF